MKKVKKIKEVEGSPDFSKFFESLSEDDPFKIEIRDVMKLLFENYTRGDRIKHDRWPNSYKKYKFDSVWRYDLSNGRRLTYTILGDADSSGVIIIEAFTSHKKYEKRFGY